MKNYFALAAAATLALASQDAHALTCASQSIQHTELPLSKFERKRQRVNPTLRAFFPFADSIDIHAAKLSKVTIDLNGSSYNCSTSKNTIQVDCGPISLKITGQGSHEKRAKTVDDPLNKPWPFDYAVLNNKNYALVSRYALNEKYNPLQYKTTDPKWVSPSNMDASVEKKCASWKTLKTDKMFSHLVKPMGKYYHGDIVCIESVRCSKNSSITTLSASMSLIPIKYLNTIHSMTSQYNYNGYTSWKKFLEKINPLLALPDIQSATLTVVIESPLESYNSVL